MERGLIKVGNFIFGVVAQWYDIWVGCYYDTTRGRLYIMIPFVGIFVQYAPTPQVPK